MLSALQPKQRLTSFDTSVDSSSGRIGYKLSKNGTAVAVDIVDKLEYCRTEVLLNKNYMDIVRECLSLQYKNNPNEELQKFAFNVAEFICRKRGWYYDTGICSAMYRVFFGKELVGYIFSGIGFISMQYYRTIPRNLAYALLPLENTSFIERISVHLIPSTLHSPNPVYAIDSYDSELLSVLEKHRNNGIRMVKGCGYLLNSSLKRTTPSQFMYFVEDRALVSSYITSHAYLAH